MDPHHRAAILAKANDTTRYQFNTGIASYGMGYLIAHDDAWYHVDNEKTTVEALPVFVRARADALEYLHVVETWHTHGRVTGYREAKTELVNWLGISHLCLVEKSQ